MGKVINFMEALNMKKLDSSIEATAEKIIELITNATDLTDDGIKELHNKMDKLRRDCLLANGLIDDAEYEYMTQDEIANIFHNPYDSYEEDSEYIINMHVDLDHCL